MALTPEDIRDKKFSTVRGLREGYHIGEVDRFLEEVRAEVARLRVDLEALREHSTNGENNASAVRMLELAQRTAEDHIAAAQQEAQRLIDEARQQVARMQVEADAQRSALERRVDDLREFEREYRARLRTFIEAQITELEGRGQG